MPSVTGLQNYAASSFNIPVLSPRSPCKPGQGAVAAVSDEGEDDLSDGMSDVSEDPSNVSAVEGTSTSRRDKRWNTTFNTISAAGLQPLFMPPEKDKNSSAIRGAICVDPVPSNIHPVHNEGRRKARAEAILGKIDSSSTALFGSLVNAATVVTGFTPEAEELAIAVALQERRRDVTTFSDSRTAIRSFSSGFVSAAAASIVNKTTADANEVEDPLTHIIWFPGPGPHGAHQLARELATRGGDRPSQTGRERGCMDIKDPLISFHEITSAHKLGRRLFPPPHPKLNKAQAVTLRQLQTETYITPAMLNRIDPDFTSLSAL
ncbi:hypothetical protein HPB52_006206 [Rhipicephalus sanguineus]|uniref:Tick transposon n=1 Tax=Rhipicephalus sanguineus TaxID=34632 RepID=A0A9D4STF1_RHISA|nr:hypothetical protein HPB52_006206 [Rhipicephalus sanguineus]